MPAEATFRGWNALADRQSDHYDFAFKLNKYFITSKRLCVDDAFRERWDAHMAKFALVGARAVAVLVQMPARRRARVIVESSCRSVGRSDRGDAVEWWRRHRGMVASTPRSDRVDPPIAQASFERTDRNLAKLRDLDALCRPRAGAFDPTFAVEFRHPSWFDDGADAVYDLFAASPRLTIVSVHGPGPNTQLVSDRWYPPHNEALRCAAGGKCSYTRVHGTTGADPGVKRTRPVARPPGEPRPMSPPPLNVSHTQAAAPATTASTTCTRSPTASARTRPRRRAPRPLWASTTSAAIRRPPSSTRRRSRRGSTREVPSRRARYRPARAGTSRRCDSRTRPPHDECKIVHLSTTGAAKCAARGPAAAEPSTGSGVRL